MVWLDVLLPGMNGLEVIRALRDTSSLLDANKVILTSASWYKEIEAQRDRSEGVVATLRKPFDLDEALTLLRRVAG